MGEGEYRGIPADLALGRSQLQAWRGTRKLGERIPQPLWDLAVRLAKLHGVSRIATELRLDYYTLQRRAGAAATPAPSSHPAFVEVSAPILGGKECRLEFDNGAGATLRVQLVGYDAADVEALSRSFWTTR
jgi:hypothetical protein